MSYYKIAVDSGKSETKIVMTIGDGAYTKNVFETAYEEYKYEYNPSTFSTGETSHLKLDGKNYAVGKKCKIKSVGSEKANEVHRLSIITAIGLITGNDPDIKVDVAIGYPLTISENQENVKRYIEFIFPTDKREFDFAVNGISKHIAVKSVKVVPEAIGFIYYAKDSFFSNPDILGEEITVVDIGGWNVNAYTADSDGHIIFGTKHTSDMGTKKFIEDFMEEYNRIAVADIKPATAFMWLSNNRIPEQLWNIEGDSTQFIREQKMTFFKSIVNDLITNELDIDNTIQVFMGGGAEMFKEQIKELFPHAHTYPESKFINAIGFAKSIK